MDYKYTQEGLRGLNQKLPEEQSFLQKFQRRHPSTREAFDAESVDGLLRTIDDFIYSMREPEAREYSPPWQKSSHEKNVFKDDPNQTSTPRIGMSNAVANPVSKAPPMPDRKPRKTKVHKKMSPEGALSDWIVEITE